MTTSTPASQPLLARRPRELVSSIGLPLAAAALGSVATASGTSSAWYRGLDKPAIQPPAAVFPIAWTALYTQSAVGSVLAQRRMDAASARAYRGWLALNMALNAGWCWSFFGAKRIAPSIAVAGALALGSADLARRVGEVHRPAGALLAPYAAWCGFATVLTTAIWRRNRHG